MIAVALFAALSYAVTQTGRGGGDTSKEQEAIAAAQITQYAALIYQTIVRLKLTNGCLDTQINFGNSIVAGYNNALAPGDGTCDVFGSGGGGIALQKMPAGTGDASGYPIFSGRSNFLMIGTSNVELTMFVPIQSQSLCAKINSGLNLPASMAIDAIDTTPPTKFAGTYFLENAIPDNGGNAAGYMGARAACLQAFANALYYPYSVGINYFFYSVLMER